MKKWIFFAIISTTVLVGCNNQPDTNVKFGKQTFTLTGDTTITVIENKTAPRYSCSQKLLRNPVLLEEVKKQQAIHLTTAVTIDVDSLIKTLPAYAKFKKPLDEEAQSSWFSDLLKILAAIALIALLVWLLWWLSKQTPRSSSGDASVVVVNPSASTGNQSTKNEMKYATSHTSSITSSIGKEDYDGIKAIIVELQKRPGGGNVKLGALEVDIPSIVPNVHIDGSKKGNVGDVEINIFTASADMMTNYAGDNHSQYSRGQKSAEEKNQS